MRILQTLKAGPIIELSSGIVVFIADFDIDCDGSGGNPDHDPCFQPATSLRFRGQSLNAYQVPFVVVPPIIVQKTKGIVLGCRAVVTNFRTGLSAVAVVGDEGPTFKDGEGSPALAQALGLDPNPRHGGTGEPIIGYEIFPGVGAEVDGILYDLQPWRK